MTPTSPRAIIADDEALLALELQALLQDSWPALQIVGIAATGTAALRLAQEQQPDIAFIDIRMPGLNGLELARLLPSSCRCVFVTAHAEHALEAFEQAAVDYLRKPVTPARLALTVQRLQAHLQSHLQERAGPSETLRFVQAWLGNSLLVLEVEQIALLRSDQRYTQVVALDGRSLLLRSSLAELLPQLDATLFWQVHRSAVINARAIASVERDADGELRVHLRGLATAVAVSRTQRARFRGM